MKAWHFTGIDKRLANGDGRLIRCGRTLVWRGGPPVMCMRGFHGSVESWDALCCAPGPYVWRVELGGDVIRGSDKCVASERTALWGYDATEVLYAFARRCALDCVDRWACPELVLRWLRTGDRSLRSAARDAAWTAARDAGGYAEWSAAQATAQATAKDAAQAAARDAARSAARSATEYAVGSAAWSAAWAAAWAAPKARLTRMLLRGRP